MKAKLKRDIVIPAGTEFDTAPSKTERFGVGHIDCCIGLTRDVSATLSLCIGGPGDSERTDAKEWFEIVQDESSAGATNDSGVSGAETRAEPQVKTIREWLAGLPGEYGKRALANMEEKQASAVEYDAATALIEAFNWEESPEGFDFWSGVYDSLDSDATLPSLEGLPPMRSTGE